MEILLVYGIAFVASFYFSILRKYSLMLPILFLSLFAAALASYLIFGNLSFSVWGILWLPALLVIKQFQKHSFHKLNKRLKVPLIK